MLFKKRSLIIVALIFAGNVMTLPSFARGPGDPPKEVRVVGQRLTDQDRDDGGSSDMTSVSSIQFSAVSDSHPGSRFRGYQAAITNGIGQPAPAVNSCQTDPKSGTPTPAPVSGAPVILSSGSKYLKHQDFTGATDLSLGLTRTYRSDLPYTGGILSSRPLFGSNWRSNFDYSLELGGLICSGYSNCQINNITFRMPDGAAYVLYLYMPPTGPNGAPGPVNGKYLYITATAMSFYPPQATGIYAEYDLVTKAIVVRDT